MGDIKVYRSLSFQTIENQVFMTEYQALNGTFSQQMNLCQFPFDVQV